MVTYCEVAKTMLTLLIEQLCSFIVSKLPGTWAELLDDREGSQVCV